MSTARRVRGTIDCEALRRDIRRRMDGPPRISYREVERQIRRANGGEGPRWNSLAQVVGNERVPDAAHYAQICNWLGVPLEKYTGRATPHLVGPDYVEAALLREGEPLPRDKAVVLADIFRLAYKVLAPEKGGPNVEHPDRPASKGRGPKDTTRARP